VEEQDHLVVLEVQVVVLVEILVHVEVLVIPLLQIPLKVTQEVVEVDLFKELDLVVVELQLLEQRVELLEQVEMVELELQMIF
jgi:hypothetical protein|tara:strand:- start:385 stop:633 length:249 start_codon:yes stop_codon:yes gene_type:complete